MAKAEIPAEAREISYEAFARPVSETAANAHKRLYGKSGAMNYRVILGQSGGGMKATIVNAETGDEAADAALARNPGWKCINVTPASETVSIPGEGGATLVTGGYDALDAA